MVWKANGEALSETGGQKNKRGRSRNKARENKTEVSKQAVQFLTLCAD